MKKKTNWVKVDEQQLEVAPDDLFEHYETLPQEVKDVLHKHQNDDGTYENCEELIYDLRLIGYTCDYGLDGVPYDLQKIERLEQKDLEETECYIVRYNDCYGDGSGVIDECIVKSVDDFKLWLQNRNDYRYSTGDSEEGAEEFDLIRITMVSYK